MSLPPVRCYHCFKPLEDYPDEFQKYLTIKYGNNHSVELDEDKNRTNQEFFEERGIVRFCCRGIIASAVSMLPVTCKLKM